LLSKILASRFGLYCIDFTAKILHRNDAAFVGEILFVGYSNFTTRNDQLTLVIAPHFSACKDGCFLSGLVDAEKSKAIST